MPTPGGGRRQAVPGIVGVAGLDADGARIGREQPVETGRLEPLVSRGGGQGNLPGAHDVAQLRIVEQQRGGDHGQIVGGAVVVRLVQTTRIREVRIAEVHRLRLAVHPIQELAAGHQGLCQGLGGVVPGVQQHPIKQLAHGELLTRRQAHVVRDHLGGGRRHGQPLVWRGQVQRHHGGHHFGQRGVGNAGMRVQSEQDLPGLDVDHDGMLAVDDGHSGDGMGGQPSPREGVRLDRWRFGNWPGAGPRHRGSRPGGRSGRHCLHDGTPGLMSAGRRQGAGAENEESRDHQQQLGQRVPTPGRQQPSRH